RRERLALGGGREAALQVLLLLRLERVLDVFVEADDLPAGLVAAEHRHEPLTVKVTVTALLVERRVLGARGVRLDDGEVEGRFLWHSDVRAGGERAQRGERRDQGPRTEAAKGHACIPY